MSFADRYRNIRRHSLALIEPLSAEDCAVQSMPDASPAKWHLAHTSWFFETVVLQPHAPGYQPVNPRYSYLFNSYYNGLGPRHPRPERGLLTRPSLQEVLDYRRQIDEAMLGLLDEQASADALRLGEIGLQHEQQHQELLLTDIKHLLSCNPLLPAYRAWQEPELPDSEDGWLERDGGLYQIGSDGKDFAYDNETPRHPVHLQPYAIARRLVSNAEFLAFIEDGGYHEPAHWLSDGWDWLRGNDLEAPLYWLRQGDDWQEFTLGGPRPLSRRAPACHLSFYEADAYARWAGARLPTEAEWEAAAPAPVERPQRVHPDGQGWFDQVWQWTSSAYAPYPGYRPASGPLIEYNAKFMCNQLVLRGGSCFSPPGHVRASYRNFFYPQSRWQMSGLRLARDL